MDHHERLYNKYDTRQDQYCTHPFKKATALKTKQWYHYRHTKIESNLYKFYTANDGMGLSNNLQV